jgi:hypothetical protein
MESRNKSNSAGALHWADENLAISELSIIPNSLSDREAPSCPLSLREKLAELAAARERVGVRGNAKLRSLPFFCMNLASATKLNFK